MLLLRRYNKKKYSVSIEERFRQHERKQKGGTEKSPSSAQYEGFIKEITYRRPYGRHILQFRVHQR